jgi:hypothetical protein
VQSPDSSDSGVQALDLLAEWLPQIEGKAFAPGSGGGRPDGRPDAVDQHHRELASAMAALQRLDALARAPGGEQHVLVLAFLYLHLGPQERVRIARSYEQLDGRVGYVFAERERRQTWLQNPAPSQGHVAAQRLGKRLREAATVAYESPALEVLMDSAPRLSLASVRAHVQRLVRETDEDRHTTTSARRRAAGTPRR